MWEYGRHAPVKDDGYAGDRIRLHKGCLSRQMDRRSSPLYWYGQNGDQDINWAQNATLAGCGHNGVDVHLFEVIDEGEYVYCGLIELVDKPYTETQPGEDGNPRKVWMFPIRPVPDNDVKKPPMFVF